MKRCRTAKRIIRPVFLIFIWGLTLCSCQKKETEIILEPTEETEESQKEGEAVSEPVFIWVDVGGAVKQPGVYQLKENARLFEAIEAAGGVTQEADTQWLNQALVLADGEKIQVYTREETEKMENKPDSGYSDQGETSGKINLNTATLEGLQEIPGIGEVRARAIVDYREETGGFRSIEDIQQVPGIKGKIYEKISEYITVE